MVVRAVLEPGSRLLVRFASDPGRDHERIAGWPVDDTGWVVASPNHLLAEEPTSSWERVLDVSGSDVYPDDVDEAVSFSRPLEDFETADIVARARDEALRLRNEAGRPMPTSAPSQMRLWSGAYVSLPAEGGVAALRRRIMGKTSNFEVGKRGHLRGTVVPVTPEPAVLPVADAGAAVPAADVGAAAGAPVGTPGALGPPIGRLGGPGAAGVDLGAGGGFGGAADAPRDGAGARDEGRPGDRAHRRPRGAGVDFADTDALQPRAGHVWLTTDFTFGALGVEVTMTGRSVAHGTKGVYVNGDGLAGFVQQVPMGRVGSFVDDLRRTYGWTEPPAAAAVEGATPAEPPAGGAAAPEAEADGDLRTAIDKRLATRDEDRADDREWPEKGDVEELRTLYVDYDNGGIRYKDWKVGVQECSTYRFGDFPHSGPPECLKFCRAVARDYENIRRWFQAWCEKFRLSEADRLWHEMSILVETLHFGLTYDQLNMGALASFELITRRVMAIMEHVNSGKDSGNWSAAKYLIARRGPGDLMSRELHRHVAEEARTDHEISLVRKKAVAAVGDAAAAGGLPALPADDDGSGAAGKGRARGGRRARGRGRQ